MTRPHHELLRMAQGRICCYCGVRLLRRGAQTPDMKIHPQAETTEHLRRKADGGGCEIDNKALACYKCNTGRGDTDWMTYKSIKLGEFDMMSMEISI